MMVVEHPWYENVDRADYWSEHVLPGSRSCIEQIVVVMEKTNGVDYCDRADEDSLDRCSSLRIELKTVLNVALSRGGDEKVEEAGMGLDVRVERVKWIRLGLGLDAECFSWSGRA